MAEKDLIDFAFSLEIEEDDTLLGSLTSTMKNNVASGGLASTSGSVASATGTFTSTSGVFVPFGKPEPGKVLGFMTLKKEPGTVNDP